MNVSGSSFRLSCLAMGRVSPSSSEQAEGWWWLRVGESYGSWKGLAAVEVCWELTGNTQTWKCGGWSCASWPFWSYTKNRHKLWFLLGLFTGLYIQVIQLKRIPYQWGHWNTASMQGGCLQFALAFHSSCFVTANPVTFVVRWLDKMPNLLLFQVF